MNIYQNQVLWPACEEMPECKMCLWFGILDTPKHKISACFSLLKFFVWFVFIWDARSWKCRMPSWQPWKLNVRWDTRVLKMFHVILVVSGVKMGGYKPQNKETLPTSLSAKKTTKPKQLNDAEGLRCLAASNKPGGSGGMDVWTHVRLTSC